jgi:hypothetical protein
MVFHVYGVKMRSLQVSTETLLDDTEHLALQTVEMTELGLRCNVVELARCSEDSEEIFYLLYLNNPIENMEFHDF